MENKEIDDRLRRKIDKLKKKLNRKENELKERGYQRESRRYYYNDNHKRRRSPGYRRRSAAWNNEYRHSKSRSRMRGRSRERSRSLRNARDSSKDGSSLQSSPIRSSFSPRRGSSRESEVSQSSGLSSLKIREQDQSLALESSRKVIVAQTSSKQDDAQAIHSATGSSCQTQPPVVSAAVQTVEKVDGKEEELNPEVLQAIGDKVHPERKFAARIHSKFAAGAQEVVQKGLPEEKRKILLEKFISPENCIFLDPPKVNPGVKIWLKEAVTARDDRIVLKQGRITAGLAGLMDVVVKIAGLKRDEKFPIKESTEALWGVVQLLADLQHEESVIRRQLIIKNINFEHRETLKATNIDEWLFGEKLDEQIKAIKTLESSSKSLKPQALQGSQSQSKNQRGPLRRQPYRESYMMSSGRKPYQSQGQSRSQKQYTNRRPIQSKSSQSSRMKKKA